ncbi:protein SHQ1 [Elysia marginata]|uniref:Protein SHQ1 homolog n=1 Tax=Elysia marginata TaxID=1093978 RepID=A0AAV4FD36_9GAST|nr:protein SHQ1 [Elysia marginata]
MLTPRFSLSQDVNFVFINIHAPFIKISDADCYVSDDEFYFYAEPYYLRLHLPGEVIDDENSASQSQYDVDKGQLIVRLLKKIRGQWFEGLDMLTKLLTPKRAEASNHVEVEVIASANEEDDDEGNKTELDFEFDWFVEQTVQQPDCELKLEGPKYGFARKKSNALNDVTSVLTSMIDLKNPDSVPEEERRRLRLQQESEAFNCEHYLADYFEDEAIQESVLLDFEDIVSKDVKFSEKELNTLATLPRREYIVDKSDLKSVYLGLVDLVYAYSFNYRFTNGAHNVESDWTISKLSATLSWLDYFENVNEVVISCARRSLCFPCFRNWNLIQRVIQDVQRIFLHGKTNVLKCLLGIYFVFSESETRYPLNDLYLTDYCVWVQRSDPNQLKSMAEALGKVEISKSDMDFNLEAMEKEAKELMSSSDAEESAKDVEGLSTALSNIVHIKEVDSSDSDDDRETDTSDSDTESEEADSDCSSENDSNDPVGQGEDTEDAEKV